MVSPHEPGAMDADRAAPALAPPPLLLRRTDRLLGAIAALALAGMVLLTCVDVIGRYLLNHPLTGAFELSELAMGALVFASLPLVTLRRQHVTVDMFDWLLPPRWRAVQNALASLVAALCTAVVAWRLWLKAQDMLHTGETSAELHIPIYPLVYYMALLSLVTAAVILAMIWFDAAAHPESP